MPPEPDPSIRRAEDASGWRVMDAGLAAARQTFGHRLVAAFAIGSLAHGGFAPAVSDVDLALILSDLSGRESDDVAEICEIVRRGDPSPLASRLSVFWSTWAELESGTAAGRLPLTDLLDLAESGVLLAGADQRGRIRRPDAETIHRSLVCESARFMLDKLATAEGDARLRDPRKLIELGCRSATKAVLFPARFLFTAHTGRAAGNEDATRFVEDTLSGPARDVVIDAYHWRTSGSLGDEERALRVLSAGLLPLYAITLDTYVRALDTAGELDLAAGLRSWRDRLAGR